MTGRVFNIQRFSINDGPGIRTTVFLSGCPLRCGWCSNPESQTIDASRGGKYASKEYTPGEVMDIVARDMDFYIESGGGMTLSGGEALLQAEFSRELLTLARNEGIHTAVETTGCVPKDVFRSFLELADLFLYDVKHADSETHRRFTGVGNELIIENLKAAAAAGANVTARVPVIPGFNADIKSAHLIASLIKDIGIKAAELLPFHQFGEKKYEELGIPYAWKGVRQLHEEELYYYRDIFAGEGLECRFG